MRRWLTALVVGTVLSAANGCSSSNKRSVVDDGAAQADVAVVSTTGGAGAGGIVGTGGVGGESGRDGARAMDTAQDNPLGSGGNSDASQDKLVGSGGSSDASRDDVVVPGSGGKGGEGGVATGGIQSGTGGMTGVGGASTGGRMGSGGSTSAACPGSSAYVGSSSWPDQLVVTAGAQYCGAFKEIRNLDEEYAAKAKLTIAPGTYRLPATAGTYDFAHQSVSSGVPGWRLPGFPAQERSRPSPRSVRSARMRATGIS